ncbi:unnamed protein product [Urochloa humidicola]
MAPDAGEGPDHDRLSDLPDDILVSIVSLLPINQAARCSVLASRWPRIFPRTFLEFRAYGTDRRDAIDVVNSILATHPAAPVRSFSIAFLRPRDGVDPSGTGGWLQDLALRGVQELCLSSPETTVRPVIPASLFACAALTRLEASSCTFPDAHRAAAIGEELFIEDAPKLEWVLGYYMYSRLLHVLQ